MSHNLSGAFCPVSFPLFQGVLCFWIETFMGFPIYVGKPSLRLSPASRATQGNGRPVSTRSSHSRDAKGKPIFESTRYPKLGESRIPLSDAFDVAPAGGTQTSDCSEKTTWWSATKRPTNLPKFPYRLPKLRGKGPQLAYSCRQALHCAAAVLAATAIAQVDRPP